MMFRKSPAEFQEAYSSAVRTYGYEVWLTLHPREQTAAIYQEMRRIDAERYGMPQFVAPISHHRLRAAG